MPRAETPTKPRRRPEEAPRGGRFGQRDRSRSELPASACSISGPGSLARLDKRLVGHVGPGTNVKCKGVGGGAVSPLPARVCVHARACVKHVHLERASGRRRQLGKFTVVASRDLSPRLPWSPTLRLSHPHQRRRSRATPAQVWCL